jgi:hypothetical protein
VPSTNSSGGADYDIPRRKVEAALVVELVSCHSPDQLGLPFSLWTREGMGELIKRRLGLKLSPWTVGRYLKK